MSKETASGAPDAPERTPLRRAVSPGLKGLHVPRPVQDAPHRLALPQAATADLIEALETGTLPDKPSVHRFKMVLARRHKLAKVPSDADLLAALPDDLRAKHQVLLRTKATRTLSGVAIVTIQSSPEHCPHGTCIFCPGGPDVGSAQSYTGEEPAALRARSHAFDPYAQTASRLVALHATGHDTDKVDLIIQGGTFTARETDYQRWFVKRALDAMNDAAHGWENGTDPETRPGAATIGETKRINETAPARCIGLTVETKPDWWQDAHIDLALDYGATRVELGVQTVFDDILDRTNRGHTVQESIEATRRAKEAGFKLCHHLMPGLPRSTPARDIDSARTLFASPDWRPDMLKIYPTLVMPGTPLAVLHERGDYHGLDTESAAEVIAETMRLVPPYVRIQRVDRDIPTTLVAAGVDKSNVRQLAEKVLMDKYGARCLDVRAREVGHLRRDATPEHAAAADAYRAGRLVLNDLRYAASGGEERFLTIEDEDDGALFGYLRLRRLTDPARTELGAGDAMIREVKIPGTVVPVGGGDDNAAQHRGLGTRLCAEAARIAAEEWDTERLFVIAGIGVKPYYRKLGFHDDGVYLRAAARQTEDGLYGLQAPRGVPDVPRAAGGTVDLDA